ncbi:MAG: hypothetical protein AB1861_03420 [Cyanobacteriota bacterium]
MDRTDKAMHWIVTRTLAVGAICAVAATTSHLTPSLKEYKQGWENTGATFLAVAVVGIGIINIRDYLPSNKFRMAEREARQRQTQQARSEELLDELQVDPELLARLDALEAGMTPLGARLQALRTRLEQDQRAINTPIVTDAIRADARIAVQARLERIQQGQAPEPEPPRCETCEFHDNNPYLPCAVHPSGPDPTGCRDYTPKLQTWHFIQIRGGENAGTYFYREQQELANTLSVATSTSSEGWLKQMGWINPNHCVQRRKLLEKFGAKTLNQLVGKSFKSSKRFPYEALEEFLSN